VCCIYLLLQAKEAEGAENAVMLLTHLTTFIMMLQDERVRGGSWAKFETVLSLLPKRPSSPVSAHDLSFGALISGLESQDRSSRPPESSLVCQLTCVVLCGKRDAGGLSYSTKLVSGTDCILVLLCRWVPGFASKRHLSRPQATAAISTFSLVIFFVTTRPHYHVGFMRS